MVLQVTITGDIDIKHGQQTELTASVIDTDTSLAPTQPVLYEWSIVSGNGSFVGNTDEASVTYLANIAGNADETVDISCEATIEAHTATVSDPSLTAFETLGINGQILNMYITETEATVIGPNKTIYEDTSADSELDAGSDDDLSSTIQINRVRYHNGGRRFIFGRDGTGSLSDFFSSNTAQSVFIMFSGGDAFEIDNSIYDTGADSWCRWVVDTTLGARLNNLGADETFLISVGNAGSLGFEEVSETENVELSIAPNEPPVVSVTAAPRVTPNQQIEVTATVTEPENESFTGAWTATGGVFEDSSLVTTMWTAPATSGDYVLTFTATDSDGQVGSNSAMVVVNSAPSVTLNVGNRISVSGVLDVSVTVTDPNLDTVTVVWSATDGTFADANALSTTWTAPATPGDYTLTLTATDSFNAVTTETAMVTVTPNNAPTVTLNVPAEVDVGQSLSVSAVVADPDNDSITVRWTATGGSFGDATAVSTTWDAPNVIGAYTLTLTATDQHSESTAESVQVNVVAATVSFGTGAVELLPPSSSNLERDLVRALDTDLIEGLNFFRDDNAMPVRRLFDPDRVSTALLPYVAYVLSIDYWDSDWSETQKRNIVRSAYRVQSEKGTIQSVKRVVEALGFTVTAITEDTGTDWAKYEITIAEPISNSVATDLRALIDQTAPLRNELTGINFTEAANSYDGTVTYDGSANYGTV